MKTIKVTVRVSGYLKEGDNKSWDGAEDTISVECADSLDDNAIKFLSDAFPGTAWTAVKAYRDLANDYREVKNES